MDIQQEIEEALKNYDAANEQDEVTQSTIVLQENVYDWLRHQQEIISQQSASIEYWKADAKRLDEQSMIKKGLIDYQAKQISQLAAEIERLKNGIRLMRDEVYDAYVPAYLSAKIGRQVEKLLNPSEESPHVQSTSSHTQDR